MPNAGTSGLPQMSSEPVVYMGSRFVSPPGGPVSYADDVRDFDLKTFKDRQVEVRRELSISKAMKKFDDMSFEEQRDMYRLLLIAGFAGDVPLEEIEDEVQEAPQIVAREAYKALLTEASDIYMNTRRLVSPTDVLRSAIAYRLGSIGVKWNGNLNYFDNGVTRDMIAAAKEAGFWGTEDELEPFKQKYTTTQIDRDYLNPIDARGLVRETLQQQLGRDPTQAEYEDFLAALNAAERANPAIKKTTVVDRFEIDPQTGEPYVEDRTSRSRMVSSPMTETGFRQLLYEKAQQHPDWAEWQAVGTYFPALLEALGATVPGR